MSYWLLTRFRDVTVEYNFWLPPSAERRYDIFELHLCQTPQEGTSGRFRGEGSLGPVSEIHGILTNSNLPSNSGR